GMSITRVSLPGSKNHDTDTSSACATCHSVLMLGTLLACSICPSMARETPLRRASSSSEIRCCLRRRRRLRPTRVETADSHTPGLEDLGQAMAGAASGSAFQAVATDVMLVLVVNER